MDFIKFLGTAGARFVMIKQLRSSGGIWISLDDTNILIDPGPGSLIRCLSSKPRLDPKDLDGIILTHRHIDHSNDINLMIEAMTDGGFKKKGKIFAPKDALEGEPVIFKYARDMVNEVVELYEGGKYSIKNLEFDTPVKHLHGVETYGINIHGKDITISLITDTKYFDGLENFYKGDILILNVVRLEPRDDILHLSLKDAERIISHNKPKLSILTHFGMTMLKAKPWEIAENLSRKLNLKVVAANDGMVVDVEKYRNK